ncbi:hypothetical protein [Lentibacillus sp. CBA3610]|nr:hypothetical protein [Lentibacillus sp. CBA3610]
MDNGNVRVSGIPEEEEGWHYHSDPYMEKVGNCMGGSLTVIDYEI